ncbi:MAG: glycosyltransferase family 1 protein [Candidatus Saccharimonadales bacterium]
MKIAIDAREYPTSTGRYVRKLLEYLEEVDANSDREYVVMLYAKDFDTYHPKAKNFSKVIADFKEFTFSEQFGFLRLIRNLKPDLVHFTLVQQPIFYHRKVITTLQDFTTLRFNNPSKNILTFKFKQFIYLLVNIIASIKSKQLITPTEFVKNDAIRLLKSNPRKITVTLESADRIAVPAEEFAPLKNESFLMYVGRSLPHKNLERLIDAFSLLKKSHPNLQLALVGKKDDHMERHLDYAQKHNVPDVLATGYVSEGQLRWLYENTTCYCFPSLSEGFGLPALEAMKHGAPVASSNATCLPEVNGDAVHYFNPLDIEDMAAKINDVLTNKKLRGELIKKGVEQVKKYSWQRMTEQTLEVYKKALKS